MPSWWANESEQCTVDDDGVHFRPLERAPLDFDWDYSLEAWLVDPQPVASVREEYPSGTADEVTAEVIARLVRMGRPVPPIAPKAPHRVLAAASPPARVREPIDPPLPPGQGDAAAIALAHLVATVARAFDPGVPAVQDAFTGWGPPDREDNHAPLICAAQCGPVWLGRQVDEDGRFVCFHAAVTALPPNCRVMARWDGARALSVGVMAPAAMEQAVRGVLGGPFLDFLAC